MGSSRRRIVQYAEEEFPGVVSIGPFPSDGGCRAPLAAIIMHVANYDVERSSVELIPLTYDIICIFDGSWVVCRILNSLDGDRAK